MKNSVHTDGPPPHYPRPTVPIPGHQVTVVGAGLAGVECALQLAQRGLRVALVEMRPHRMTPAHNTGHLAELVCSNSFKSVAPSSGHGILKQDLGLLGCHLLAAARHNAVPAGQALAVDRGRFSEQIDRVVTAHPLITLVRGEVTSLPCPRCLPPGEELIVLATGPLTTTTLAKSIFSCPTCDQSTMTGKTGDEETEEGTRGGAREGGQGADQGLYFYDAIAPIIDGESIDRQISFAASRYDKGGADYLNCPMTREQYEVFFQSLCEAEKVTPHWFEDTRAFQGCQPVETIASTGKDSLRFGPMKPVGLLDPTSGRRPWAVVQLRKEDEAGNAWNMVGFQTRLTYPEQRRVVRKIPGLENARFLRLGAIHRNTYIDSPKLLHDDLSLRSNPRVFITGQLTGVEGYMESVAAGLICALTVSARLRGAPFHPPPPESAIGGLYGHIRPRTSPSINSGKHPFQPSAVHFGLLPPFPFRIKKSDRGKYYLGRSIEAVEEWVGYLGLNIKGNIIS